MSDVCIVSAFRTGLTQCALPVSLFEIWHFTCVQNRNISVMRSWRPEVKKTQNEMYCAVGDGVKEELPTAVRAAGTLCGAGLFEQLITEGSQPA